MAAVVSGSAAAMRSQMTPMEKGFDADGDGWTGSLIDTLILTSESEDSRSCEDVSDASYKDRMKRLANIVLDLEKLDSAWREAITQQPSVTEQTLCMLILGHVSSDLFLSRREKNMELPNLPEKGIQTIVDELEAKGGDCVTMTTSGEQENGSGPEDQFNPGDLFVNSWHPLACLIQGLEELRKSFTCHAHMSVPVKFVSEQSTELEIDGGEIVEKRAGQLKDLPDMKTREEYLVDILCTLSEGRLERSYAPPTDNELTFYRDIRKWITSTVAFFRGKDEWLSTWVSTGTSNSEILTGEAACADHFPVERAHTSTASDWEFIIAENTMSCVEFHAPIGHKTAQHFDHLHEFQFLLTHWKERLNSIIKKTFGQGALSKHEGTCTDAVNIELDGRKRVHVQQVSQARKKNKLGLYGARNVEVCAHSCKPTAGDEVTKRENRGKYLVDILSIFTVGQDCLSPESWLSDREVRLYARILQHVRASVWLFRRMATPRDMNLYGQMIEAESKVPAMLKHGPRESHLQEIVSLVEKIESESLFCAPSAEEVVLYEKIQGHMNVNLMEWRCHKKLALEGKVSGTAEQHHDLEAVARSAVKAIWETQMKIADDLEKFIGDALHTLFPQAPPEGNKVVEWLHDNIEDVMTNLSGQLRMSYKAHEFLNSFVLSLYELHFLMGNIIQKSDKINMLLLAALRTDAQRYEVPLMESWGAFRVKASLMPFS